MRQGQSRSSRRRAQRTGAARHHWSSSDTGAGYYCDGWGCCATAGGWRRKRKRGNQAGELAVEVDGGEGEGEGDGGDADADADGRAGGGANAASVWRSWRGRRRRGGGGAQGGRLVSGAPEALSAAFGPCPGGRPARSASDWVAGGHYYNRCWPQAAGWMGPMGSRSSCKHLHHHSASSNATGKNRAGREGHDNCPIRPMLAVDCRAGR